MFGMHPNANIIFQLQETRQLVDTVLSIQPRLDLGTGACCACGLVQASCHEPARLQMHVWPH